MAGSGPSTSGRVLDGGAAAFHSGLPRFTVLAPRGRAGQRASSRQRVVVCEALALPSRLHLPFLKAFHHLFKAPQVCPSRILPNRPGAHRSSPNLLECRFKPTPSLNRSPSGAAVHLYYSCINQIPSPAEGRQDTSGLVVRFCAIDFAMWVQEARPEAIVVEIAEGNDVEDGSRHRTPFGYLLRQATYAAINVGLVGFTAAARKQPSSTARYRCPLVNLILADVHIVPHASLAPFEILSVASSHLP